ncbi:unnamed protein product [Brassicogethes aeneus]|uniref:Uncharacterized protein n=1 Tax=Brassicogethes aeneus TaxID=1431903 RepID=A0A9P0BGY6_BRAAE|nr:unnamed protein product [Brassicogethes aeneus]
MDSIGKKRLRFTDHDDISLLREVLGHNPIEHPVLWRDNMLSVTKKNFSIRTLKDHLELLIKLWLKKSKDLKDNEISNSDIFKLLQNVQNQNKSLKEELINEIRSIKSDISKEIENIKTENANLKSENLILKKRLLTTERTLKKYNLFIYGVKEEERKPDEDIILSLVNNKLDIKCVSEEFRDIYRVGKKVTEKSRPIAIELTHYKLKLNILKAANKLKGTNIFVSQDYTQEDYQKNKLLYKYKKRALAENSEAYIKNNNLFINGEIVTYEELLEKENLSEELEESEAEEVEVSAGNSKIVNSKNSKRKENPSIEEETDNKRKSLSSNSVPQTKSSDTPSTADTPKPSRSKVLGKSLSSNSVPQTKSSDTPSTADTPKPSRSKVLGPTRARRRKVNTQKQGLAYLEAYDSDQHKLKKRNLNWKKRDCY